MTACEDMRLLLAPDSVYHIFNRGNRHQPLFYNQGNFSYFLSKYHTYMLKYWDTFAYCLLHNHYHLAIRTKSTEAILSQGRQDFKLTSRAFNLWVKEDLPRLGLKRNAIDPIELVKLKFTNDDLSETLATRFISERFRSFLLGYAKAVNKQQDFTGSLFQKLFRRKLLREEVDVMNVICYIHRNPEHHRCKDGWESYPWSSYGLFQKDELQDGCHNEIRELFGGKTEFEAYHRAYVEEWATALELPSVQ